MILTKKWTGGGGTWWRCWWYHDSLGLVADKWPACHWSRISIARERTDAISADVAATRRRPATVRRRRPDSESAVVIPTRPWHARLVGHGVDRATAAEAGRWPRQTAQRWPTDDPSRDSATWNTAAGRRERLRYCRETGSLSVLLQLHYICLVPPTSWEWSLKRLPVATRACSYLCNACC